MYSRIPLPIGYWKADNLSAPRLIFDGRILSLLPTLKGREKGQGGRDKILGRYIFNELNYLVFIAEGEEMVIKIRDWVLRSSRGLYFNYTRIWYCKSCNFNILWKTNFWLFRNGLCYVLYRNLRVHRMDSPYVQYWS